jgi:hypothetical protein
MTQREATVRIAVDGIVALKNPAPIRLKAVAKKSAIFPGSAFYRVGESMFAGSRAKPFTSAAAVLDSQREELPWAPIQGSSAVERDAPSRSRLHWPSSARFSRMASSLESAEVAPQPGRAKPGVSST